MTDMDAVPVFGPGAKFRFDNVRKSWVVLAPERLFVPDDQALAVLQLIDGKRSLGAIARDLAGRFDAPLVVIEGDVATMLQDLTDKGVIRL